MLVFDCMISFIIPTLNEEKALPATIARLRTLTGVPYEIVVSDSDSSDRTPSLGRELADTFVSYSDAPKSAGRGRNVGARAARGEILAFIDADVEIPSLSESLAKVEALFAQNPKLVGVIPWIGVVPHSERLSDRLSYGLVNGHYYIRNNWLGSSIGNGDLIIARASAFAKVGGYNELLQNSEDNEFFARLGKVGSTRLLTFLKALHEPRRERQLGWTKLWYLWLLNGVSMLLRGKPAQNTWEVIR